MADAGPLDAQLDATRADAGGCQLIDGACVGHSECCGYTGQLFDEDAGCVKKAKETLGCFESGGGACACASAPSCRIRRTDAGRDVFWTANTCLWDGNTEDCDRDLESKVAAQLFEPRCD